MIETTEWHERMAHFAPGTSELLEARALRRRADTKFVMPPPRVAEMLPSLAEDYAVLLAGELRVATYRTLYFDTPTMDLFNAHRFGRRLRQKVRIRHYPERLLSSLEVKCRRSELETLKFSAPRPFGDCELSVDDLAFIGLHTEHGHALCPQVWTHFQRITLLGLRTQERVTIDLGLTFETAQLHESLDAIAIVEVKQWPFARGTPAMSALRATGRRPGWMSKYCAAIATTRPELRLNRFHLDMRELQRGAA